MRTHTGAHFNYYEKGAEYSTTVQQIFGIAKRQNGERLRFTKISSVPTQKLNNISANGHAEQAALSLHFNYSDS